MWPLLAGMAKARSCLPTGEMLTGVEAERIGMVSKGLPREQVLRVAETLATGFAAGDPLDQAGADQLAKGRRTPTLPASVRE